MLNRNVMFFLDTVLKVHRGNNMGGIVIMKLHIADCLMTFFEVR